MMGFQMWDLYRREVISEKVDIWVSAKHTNMWSLGCISSNLKQTNDISCAILTLIIRDRQINFAKG